MKIRVERNPFKVKRELSPSVEDQLDAIWKILDGKPDKEAGGVRDRVRQVQGMIEKGRGR